MWKEVGVSTQAETSGYTPLLYAALRPALGTSYVIWHNSCLSFDFFQ